MDPDLRSNGGGSRRASDAGDIVGGQAFDTDWPR